MRNLRAVFFALLAVASSAPAFGADDHQVSNAMSSCFAFGSLSILAYGDGHCQGYARANCTIVEDARSKKVEAFKEYFAAGVCDEVAQSAVADALVESIAGVWADAVARVHCDGAMNFGCGWALADPAGWGVSFAKVCQNVAQEIIDAGTYSGLEGFCADDFKLIGTKLGEDADTARNEVCAISSSTVVDFREEYKQLSRESILKAIKIAASGACGEPSEESTCGKEQEPEAIEECSISVASRCCNPGSISRKFCLCARCHNPMRIVEGTTGGIWSDSIGQKCSCPSSSSHAQ